MEVGTFALPGVRRFPVLSEDAEHPNGGMFGIFGSFGGIFGRFAMLRDVIGRAIEHKQRPLPVLTGFAWPADLPRPHADRSPCIK